MSARACVLVLALPIVNAGKVEPQPTFVHRRAGAGPLGNVFVNATQPPNARSRVPKAAAFKPTKWVPVTKTVQNQQVSYLMAEDVYKKVAEPLVEGVLAG